MAAGSAARPNRIRLHASIHTKLIALTAGLIAAIVVFLTAYFASQQIRSLHDEQLAKVSTYGELLGAQLRSAVAFADRETAREVMTSLSADADLAAASVFGADGEPLYTTGKPSAWALQARAGIGEKHVFRIGDRAVVAVPVDSLEGPRGVLVIEVSMRRVLADQATLLRIAIAIGASALVLGVIAAWLIARSFVRRLRAIADVATEVSSDAAARREVVVDSEDEIGSLAHAFNHMLEQLRTEQSRLQVTIATLTRAEDQLAKANEELEARVARRTAELSTANVQLHGEMERRAQVELELRQAQKLESVGRLAAGIAHEINTPVQFVNDSCSFLDTATVDLLRVIAHHREALTRLHDHGTEVEAALAAAHDVEVECDVDYLVDEIPRAITRAVQGLERVTTIVRSMREFAYQDRAECAPADLNRAIESTLQVSRNEYKYVADVRTELGDLPPVACFVGELNQVFLNIIVNAAHAIEPKVAGTEQRGEIVVRTRAGDGTVTIEIEDSGTGIPPEVVDKIFDPFFTTKAIGKGTGQGLAIARAVVVDKHHGKLAVRSEPGRGSTFVIELPIGSGTAEGSGTEERAA